MSEKKTECIRQGANSISKSIATLFQGLPCDTVRTGKCDVLDFNQELPVQTSERIIILSAEIRLPTSL